ncbi:uncharacterized protein EV154DRAFT_431542, partial [Mucor mucedo]|uniref:uncharacterized protein n=1 Tax=Mucor mucedo TaxID=29922 RepID=UPI002220E47A
ELKLSIPIDKLCEGLSPEFKELLVCARKLSFSQTPDYAHYRGLFDSLLFKKSFKDDYI